MTGRQARRHAAFGTLAVLLYLIVPRPAFAAPGDIDRHYSKDGFALVGSALAPLFPENMTIDSRGRAVIVGRPLYNRPGEDQTMALVRILANGSPDPKFGNDGVVLTPTPPVSGSYRFVNDVATDGHNRILIAGRMGNAAFIARYLPSGQVDPSFGESGVVVIEPEEMSADIADVKVLGIERIAFTGTASSSTGPDHLLVGELLPDGGPALDFADAGVFVGTFEPGVAARGSQVLEATAAGDLVVSGQSGVELAALALTRTGSTRTDFGDGGSVSWGIGLGPELPLGGNIAASVDSATLDRSGRLVVAGAVCEQGARFGYCKGLVSRLDTAGSLDTSFGQGGYSVWDGERRFVGVAADRAGRVLLGTTGYLRPGGFPQSANLSVLRLTSAGIADRAFSRDGEATVDHRFAGEQAHAMAVDARGRVLVMGSGGDRTRSFSGSRIEVARYSTRAGPHDSDGDRVLDRVDRCEVNFSRRRDGCPLVDRRASVEAGTQHDVRVVLYSPLSECSAGAWVRLYAVGPRADRRVAAGSTDYRGRWEADLPQLAREVYAVIPTRRLPNAAVCKRTTTSTVRVRHTSTP